MADTGTEAGKHKADGGTDDGPNPKESLAVVELHPAQDHDRNVETAPLSDYALGTVDPLVVENLSRGVLEKLQPGLTKSRSMLEELTENQRILIETIQQENKKFADCHAYKDVNETMEKSKIYHAKLLSIKKDMVLLHEKSAKLKKRALRLQQQKNKEILEREQSRDVELEREKLLIARPAKNSPT